MLSNLLDVYLRGLKTLHHNYEKSLPSTLSQEERCFHTLPLILLLEGAKQYLTKQFSFCDWSYTKNHHEHFFYTFINNTKGYAVKLTLEKGLVLDKKLYHKTASDYLREIQQKLLNDSNQSINTTPIEAVYPIFDHLMNEQWTLVRKQGNETSHSIIFTFKKQTYYVSVVIALGSLKWV